MFPCVRDDIVYRWARREIKTLCLARQFVIPRAAVERVIQVEVRARLFPPRAA